MGSVQLSEELLINAYEDILEEFRVEDSFDQEDKLLNDEGELSSKVSLDSLFVVNDEVSQLSEEDIEVNQSVNNGLEKVVFSGFNSRDSFFDSGNKSIGPGLNIRMVFLKSGFDGFWGLNGNILSNGLLSRDTGKEYAES